MKLYGATISLPCDQRIESPLVVNATALLHFVQHSSLRVHSLLRTAVALFRIVHSPFLACIGVFAAPRGLSLSPGVKLYLIASDPHFRILRKDDIFYSYTRKVSGVCTQFFVGSVSPRPLSLTTLYCFRGIKSTLPCVWCRVVPHSIVYYTTAYKCVL